MRGLVTLLAVAALATAGCTHGPAPAATTSSTSSWSQQPTETPGQLGTPSPASTASGGDLTIAVLADKTAIHPGDTVRLDVTVRNTTPHGFRYDSYCERHAFTLKVTNATGQTVRTTWDYGFCEVEMTGSYGTVDNFPPGSNLTTWYDWDGERYDHGTGGRSSSPGPGVPDYGPHHLAVSFSYYDPTDQQDKTIVAGVDVDVE